MFELVKLPRGNMEYPITIVETRSFGRKVAEFLSEPEQAALIDYIALHPEGGVVMPGCGGIRKLRWSGIGKGKSKALRVIYLYHDLNMPVYLLAAYSKGETLQLSKREEQQMAKLADQIIKAHLSRRAEIFALGSSA
jgi:hypothetical protein